MSISSDSRSCAGSQHTSTRVTGGRGDGTMVKDAVFEGSAAETAFTVRGCVCSLLRRRLKLLL